MAFKKDKSVAGGVAEVKQVRANFADKANTCLKISKKRGLVDGVILVLDCSDIFSQDLEELAEELGIERENGSDKAEKKPKPKPAPSMPFGKSKGKQINDPSVPDDDLREMVRAKRNRLSDAKRDPKWDAADSAFVAAIEEELKTRQPKQEPQREDAAGTDPESVPLRTQQASDAPAPAQMTDEEWDLWRYDAESQRPTLYYKAKQQLKLAKGAPIPPGKRQEFREAFEKLG